MPILSLSFSARTENVSEISVPKETIWLLKIKCTSCNTTFPKQVGVSLTEQAELDKQHGMANFSAKCKQCSRKGFITILKSSAYILPIEEDGVVKGIFANFDCRGIEIQQAIMSSYFTVKVRGSNNSFQEADFSDLWCEYDDNISAVAQVEDAKFDIVLSKEK